MAELLEVPPMHETLLELALERRGTFLKATYDGQPCAVTMPSIGPTPPLSLAMPCSRMLFSTIICSNCSSNSSPSSPL